MYGNDRVIEAVTFSDDLANLKTYIWHFDFFVETGPYGDEDFKTLLLLQFLFDLSQNFMRTLSTMMEYRLLLFGPTSKF